MRTGTSINLTEERKLYHQLVDKNTTTLCGDTCCLSATQYRHALTRADIRYLLHLFLCGVGRREASNQMKSCTWLVSSSLETISLSSPRQQTKSPAGSPTPRITDFGLDQISDPSFFLQTRAIQFYHHVRKVASIETTDIQQIRHPLAPHLVSLSAGTNSVHSQACDVIDAISTLAPRDAYQDATDTTLPTKAMIDVVCNTLIGPLLRHVRASPIRRGASQYSKILGFAS
jgi:hypothetical protein